MIIGALITMAFFFAYTTVKNNAENNGFTCAISFCLVSGYPLSYVLLCPWSYTRVQPNLLSDNETLCIGSGSTLQLLFSVQVKHIGLALSGWRASATTTGLHQRPSLDLQQSQYAL
jgi:hypothetical protein